MRGGPCSSWSPTRNRRQVPKQFMVELLRAGALRADATWQANLSTLPPHQMLVLILSKESTTKFAAWSQMAATLPGSAERDGGDLEKAALLPAGSADRARRTVRFRLTP